MFGRRKHDGVDEEAAQALVLEQARKEMSGLDAMSLQLIAQGTATQDLDPWVRACAENPVNQEAARQILREDRPADLGTSHVDSPGRGC